jgi:pimeloyl-ACP methyl ester carboxylesterase
MTRRTSFALCLILIAACASAAPPRRRAVSPGEGSDARWRALDPGPVPIGFKSWLLRAQATEFHHGPQHLVQINVWYPAAAGSGTAMTFRDYVDLKATENVYEEPSDAARQAAVDEFTATLASRGIPAETASEILAAPVIARMNAGTPIQVVQVPIIFIAPARGESAADEARLAEFIASHNYVVVTIPSITRLTGPMATDSDTGARAEEQADDIDRAASAIGDWPTTVNIPVSVIGFDLGADATLLYAMHQPTNALAIVDAITSAGAVASLEATTAFDPDRTLPPILTNSDLSFVHAERIVPLSGERAHAMLAFFEEIWGPIRWR